MVLLIKLDELEEPDGTTCSKDYMGKVKDKQSCWF
jgi:hypothetical protein